MRDWSADGPSPDFACKGLTVDMSDQRTVLFASVPLDDEGWEPLPEGTAIAVRDGEEIVRTTT